jgi:hypothetical protein
MDVAFRSTTFSAGTISRMVEAPEFDLVVVKKFVNVHMKFAQGVSL